MHIPETWFIKISGIIFVHLKHYSSEEEMVSAIRDLNLKQYAPVVAIVPLPKQHLISKPAE